MKTQNVNSPITFNKIVQWKETGGTSARCMRYLIMNGIVKFR